MEAARDALERGRSALEDQHLTDAERSFARARSLFIEAGGEARNPVLRAIALLPIVGRMPDVTVALADAGERAAEAAVLVTASVVQRGGVGALAPRGGRFPIETYGAVAARVSEASSLTAAAVSEVAATSTWFLPGMISDARAEALTQLRRADETVREARDVLVALPRFLGGSGARRYLIGAQNPAELRGTGGLIGSYAIMTIDDGRPTISPFRPIRALERTTPPTVPLEDPDYRRTFGPFIGEGVWRAYNMTPDAPSASRIMVAAYRAATGVDLDGVILVDPFAVAALLEATGPVFSPELDLTLTAETYVPLVTNEAYSLFATPNERKATLGTASSRVLEAFIEGDDVDTTAALRSLIAASGGGHVRLFSTDPVVQDAFVRARLAGAFHPDVGGGFIAVIVNNVGGNKLDFYADRSVAVDVTLLADHASRTDVAVSIRNGAPTAGPPPYVIGPCCGDPPIAGFEAGEAHDLVYTFCGPPCVISSAATAPASTGRQAGSYLGAPFLREAIELRSRTSADLTYAVRSTEAWSGDEYSGRYRLTVQDQPTLRPTTLSVVVRPPPGMRIDDLPDGWSLARDGSAAWSGPIDDVAVFDVTFSRSLAWRTWNKFLDFFTEPTWQL